MRSISLLMCFLGLLLVLPASGQESSSAPQGQITQASAAPAAAPAPQAPDSQAPPASTAATAAPAWSIGPIDFSGAVDAYYSWNFNHPADRANFLYNFNVPANQFSLNYAKIAMSHTADPVGFEFDIGYGDTTKLISSVSSDTGFDQYVEQAYATFKPKRARGFEFDFGKFVTSAGAEVIESYSNWNYSRSLLFSFAIPYYHMGLRTSWPMGKHLTAGFQVVNGWNNSVDNNSGKTLGANLTATFKKFTWAGVWYGGPENAGTNQGWRELYDTTLTLTPSSKVSAYINYDFGENRNYNNAFYFFPPVGTPVIDFPDGSLSKWQGVAGALHLQATPKLAFTPRVEWFDDKSGSQTMGAAFYPGAPYGLVPPIPQQIKEVTITGEYKLLEGLMWRAEYRHDWSNQPFFEVGTRPCDASDTATSCPGDYGLGTSKKQDTITLAVVAFFGPKR